VKHRSLIFVLLVVGLALAGLRLSYAKLATAEERFSQEAALSAAEARRIQETVILFSTGTVPPGLNITDLLRRKGIDYNTAMRVVTDARPVYNLRMVRVGHQIAIGRSVLGEFRAVRYQVDLDRELWITAARPDASGFRVELKPAPSSTEMVGVTGEIRDSLFNAVTDAGEGAELALQLADIFGWDLDFYTDPRPGDTFRVVVEKKTYPSTGAVRYSRIYAAEYNNAGENYQAVLFREPSGKPAYYEPDGKSLKKAFLRSPLKFSAPITSRFSRGRFHPILKHRRPHLGIDYGAPVGTPVQTIGDGRVVSAGWNGGGGKTVHIRHSNGYETIYMHLLRILVRPGQHVSQGDRIGLVGQTGLATGPHLDFRILQRGNYRNFEALRLPPALPVAKTDWDEFVATRDRYLAQLPPLPGASVLAKQQPPDPSRSLPSLR